MMQPEWKYVKKKGGKMSKVRTFKSGAFRDVDHDKLQYTRCLSPLVLKCFCEYMREHNQTSGGKRAEDDWKKGFPTKSYMESKFRHFMDTWLNHEGYIEDLDRKQLIKFLCGELFNTMGYLHEILAEDYRPKPPYLGELTTLDTLPEDAVVGMRKLRQPENIQDVVHYLPSLSEKRKSRFTKCLLNTKKLVLTTTTKLSEVTCKECKTILICTRKIKTDKKIAIHFCPPIRAKIYKTAICGLTIRKGIQTTGEQADVTCKTCKKILYR